MASRTQASTFIIPMLSKSREKNDPFGPNSPTFFQRPSFINCYIGDVNFPEFDNKILLHYSFDNDISYMVFERELELLPTFITDYDYDGSTVYVFDVPEKFKKDFEAFQEGKYSEFSYNYKTKMLDFWEFNYPDNLIHSLLYKTDLIKTYLTKELKVNATEIAAEGEFWYKPIYKKEIFNFMLIEETS